MAYDFDSLTTFKPNSKKAARYGDVGRALRRKLTPKTRARLRKERKKLGAYMNPTDSVTGMPLKDLERGARQEAKNKYGGAIEEYGGMVRGQEQRTADIAPWYDQWRTHLTTIGQNQFQAAQQQAVDMTAQAGKLQNQDVAQQAQLANRAAGNAQAEPALQAARDASAGRAALAQGNADSVKERGQIRQGMQQSFAGNSRLEQSRQTAISQGKTEELKKKKLGLEQDAASYFHERLDAGRQSAIEAQTQQAAAKMAGLKLGETSAHNRAMEATAAANAETAAEKAAWQISPDNPDNQTKAPAAKPKHTKAKRIEYRDKGTSWKSKVMGVPVNSKGEMVLERDEAGKPITTYKIAKFNKDEAAIKKAEAKLTDGIMAGSGLPKYLAKAIAEQRMYGKIRKATAKRLREQTGNPPQSYGFKVG